MAFFAHVGTGNYSGSGDYRTLPNVMMTGILESIVSDLSAAVSSGTNNGWTLYDQFSGSWPFSGTTTGGGMWSFPWVSPSFGSLNAVAESQGVDWSFISNSVNATCFSTNGYNWAYSIGGVSGVFTPISVDGVNWYNAYYSNWPGTGYITATLDRPYAGATTHTPFIYRKVTNWIVLKNTNVIKDFYLMIGCAQEMTGGPSIWMRPCENWSTTYKGWHEYGGTSLAELNSTPWAAGQIESTTILWASVLSSGTSSPEAVKVNYMVWFLPYSFALWTGHNPWTGGVGLSSISYLGLLDTTDLRSADPFALIWIPGQTNYFGKGVYGNPNMPQTSMVSWGMGAQMMRTLDSQPWSTIAGSYLNKSAGSRDGYVWWWPTKNDYQVWPRIRWAGDQPDSLRFNPAGKFIMTEMDAYHVASPDLYNELFMANEYRRGKIRHIMVPVNNPSQLHGSTISASDGNTYIFVRHGPVIQTAINSNKNTWFANFIHEQGGVGTHMQTAWGFSTKNFNSKNLGEMNLQGSTANGGFYNYLMLPINI